MLRRLFTFAAMAGLLTLGTTACDTGWAHQRNIADADDDTSTASDSAAASADVGSPLYPPKDVPAEGDNPAKQGGVMVDPVVVPCHLSVIVKEDVPSLREGAINFIGTPLTPAEEQQLISEGKKDLIVEEQIGDEMRKFRKLKEGDKVEKGQLMAMLDDRLARAEKAVKDAKVDAAQADFKAASMTTDEALARYNTQQRLWNAQGGHTTSEEELRGAKLLWYKSAYDAKNKEKALESAKLEAKSAQTVLELHEVRASIGGVIKQIYKNPGEAVRANEPVFMIHNLDRLRAEGHMDRQQIPKVLNKPVRTVIEPTEPRSPQQTLIGHRHEITGVAVTKDAPRIVSSSEDGTVRVWDRATRHELRIIKHKDATPVRAIACTPPAASANLCLSGAADGVGRIWDLDSASDQPVCELSEHHRGAITCVAFSPDGSTCATGGEDQQIRLWDTATGKLRYTFPRGHRAAVTSVQFTPQARLVSAGRDNTLRIWELGENGARQLGDALDRRSGEVAHLGASPDGRHVLFDQGKSLRLLSLPNGVNEGILFDSTASSNFSRLALFSPDSRLIVTASATGGQLQLWRTPTPQTSNRGYEVRQLLLYQRSAVPTCACFSPDGSLLVTGTDDRQVQVWSVPTQKEVEQDVNADVSLVELEVESARGQVRVTADLPNPDGTLLPGGTATLTIYPRP
jgi:WD40 repeat protein